MNKILSLISISFLLLMGCSSHVHQISNSSRLAQFAISTSEPLVNQAALEIESAGGNIIDASIAASLAISVVRPQSTGIGGGGFMLYYDSSKNKTEAFDFREIAPLKASPKMFLDREARPIPDLSTFGALAVAVPGAIAGLYDIHKKYGKLPWAAVVEPSIRLADSDIRVSKHMANALTDAADELVLDPGMKKIFFKGNRPLIEGETFRQTDLANTLRHIAAEGKDYFYRGDFARKLSAFMRKKYGLVSMKDLSSYQMRTRAPIKARWRGYSIVSFPPPSSGGIHLIQILKIFDSISQSYKEKYGSKVAEIEAMKRAFVDRAFHLGDSDFVHVPVKHLLSDQYLQKRAKEIESHDILPSTDISPWGQERTNHETTHLSLIDNEGHVVSTTQSINGYFGAKIMVPGTGVILNNTMDDFSIQPGAANQFGLVGGISNRIQPAKRPLSSMTPTLIFDQHSKPVMAIGAPGGSRIISGVYYVLSRILREHQSPSDAIAGCRFHHQWMPDKLLVEEPCLKAFQPLEKNYKIEKTSPFGEVQLVGISQDGALYSAVDPRGHGVPLVQEIENLKIKSH